MSTPSLPEGCPRSWEVGAARDGRLLRKDLDSLRRHLATCAGCREEQQRLEGLSDGLRNLPALPDDLLAARRLRHRLLADTHRWVTGNVPAARRVPRSFVVGAVGLSALLLLGYVAFPKHAARAPVALASATAAAQAEQVPVEISEQPGSIWRKRLLGEELRIELNAGEISAKIGPRRPGQEVRIQLPDGQIEDLGTVLSVRVEEQHTSNIRVAEGRVRVSLDGHEPFELGAGEAWSRAVAEPGNTTSADGPSKATAVRAEAVHRSHSASAVTASNGAAPAAALPSSSATHAADTTDAAARSAREEDEAYLHVVALANGHQMAEARAAAKAYLLRFPNGFRRAEVLEVATH